MRCALIFVLMLSLGACGIDRPNIDSLLTSQPHVVSVEPAPGALAKRDSIVAIEFSEPIDPSSVDSSTLAIVKVDAESDGVDAVAESVVKGKVQGVEGIYSFEGEGRAVIFRAAQNYDSGTLYGVIASTKIMSESRLPLSQRRGSAPTSFVSSFVVEGEAGASVEPDTGESAAGPGSSSGGGSTSQVPRPSSLLINELLYDIPGDDTDGHLFVELVGDAGGDVSGYKILFINGDDGKATETITIPANSFVGEDEIYLIADARTGQASVTQVVGADLVNNFDPQNGPDCVQLLDQNGALIDALGYGTPIIAKAENGLACFKGTPATKPASGSSLSRTGLSDTGDNSADFRALAAPTPGAQ